MASDGLLLTGDSLRSRQDDLVARAYTVGHQRTSADRGADVDVTPHTEDLDLASVNAWEELRALLRTVHARADKPSLRTLEVRSRHGATPLSKTVVSEMLRGTRFPRKAVVLAFLEACGIQNERVDPWLLAWERIAERPVQPPAQGSAPVGSGQHAGSSDAEEEKYHQGEPRSISGKLTAEIAEVSSSGGSPATADSAETRLLRERVSQLTADNKRLRMQVVASKAPTAEDVIRSADEGGDHASPSPLASRRELGFLLRRLREERKITIEQAAERLFCSPGKVNRMESNFRSGTLRDVHDLCDFYEVTGEPRRHLMQLVQEGRQPGWWQAYGTPQYSTYIGFENDATSIKLYHSAVLPGLMQTVGYARALHLSGPYDLTLERIDQLIEVRLIRQRMLTRTDPPTFWAILDEAALHRAVGGPAAMRDQLERIVEVSRLPNVLVQVIPFNAGAHGAIDSSFTILEFNDPVPAMVYAEGLSGFFYIEKPADVEKHQRMFEILQGSALNEQDSIRFITQMIRARENST